MVWTTQTLRYFFHNDQDSLAVVILERIFPLIGERTQTLYGKITMGFEFIGYSKVKDLFSNVLCSSVMILVCLWRQFKIVSTVAFMTRKRCFQFVYCMPPSVIKASRSLFKMKYYIFPFVNCFLIWMICDFACVLFCVAPLADWSTNLASYFQPITRLPTLFCWLHVLSLCCDWFIHFFSTTREHNFVKITNLHQSPTADFSAWL